MSSVGNSGRKHRLARRQRLWSIARERLVHKKHPHITSYQKMKEAMLYLVMDPAVWQETIRGGVVTEAAEEAGESNQFAEVKAIQTSPTDCWRRKVTCLSPDSWMVANALWRLLQKWKTNWQRRDEQIWAGLHLHWGRTSVHRSKTWLERYIR